MESSPTLQDFVLNLIYDPVARDAFEIDPHGTLQEAGLGEVTAADVQDVLPLVLDFAPLNGLHSIDGLAQVDSLTTGVANLDIAGAAAHLQTITAQLGGTASHVTGDLNVAAAGAVTVTADHLVSGVLDGGLGLSTGGLFGTGGVTVDHDPAAGLDAVVHGGVTAGVTGGLTTPVEHAVTDVTYGTDNLVPHVSAGVSGSLDATVNTVTGLPGSFDLDVSGVHGATSSIVGPVLGSDVTGGLLPDGSAVHSTIAGVDHTVSGVLGGVTGATGTTDPAHGQDGHGLLGGLTGLDF
ncbi:IniB N-terminal domain-containing protein [Paractinoplanes ferrugineus]|uniref:Uncharacterized protein n=1 Tax=Paractinoplanes ferrugineus TaxID=113564 RepID=A0A919MD78_9ACTN|nr:IniB N-terminal domain-containing protein [Actinoplanes ferrugineus]GIE10294.1 hypothetical protein Afe05nite_21340 [Actinoplanes ferrugineus]